MLAYVLSGIAFLDVALSVLASVVVGRLLMWHDACDCNVLATQDRINHLSSKPKGAMHLC